MSQIYFFNHKKRVIGISIFFCVLVVILILLPTSFKDVTKKIYPELYALNIIPKPETFTELYFEKHENLPFKILSQQTYSFAFTVHNLEFKPMIYPYDVYILLNNKKITLQNGTIFLKQNQKKTIPVTMLTSLVLPTSEVIVDLPSKNQIIDFWINE